MTKSLVLLCFLVSTPLAFGETNTTDLGTVKNVFSASKSYSLNKETKGNPKILSQFKDQFSIGFFSDDAQAIQYIDIFKQDQKKYGALRRKSALQTQTFQDVNGGEIIDPITNAPATTQKRANEIVRTSDKNAVAYFLEEFYEDQVSGRIKQHVKGLPALKSEPFKLFNIHCIWQKPVYQARSCTTDYQEECDSDPFTGQSIDCHIVATTVCTPAGFYQNSFDCRITDVYGISVQTQSPSVQIPADQF